MLNKNDVTKENNEKNNKIKKYGASITKYKRKPLKIQNLIKKTLNYDECYVCLV